MSNCSKYKKTKAPKCNDQKGCQWVPKKGCNAIEYDDVVVESNDVVVESNEEYLKNIANIYMIDAGSSQLKNIEFPGKKILVTHSKKACYYPEWIIKDGEDYIKCKSVVEYNQLKKDHYKLEEQKQEKDINERLYETDWSPLSYGAVKGDIIEDIYSNNQNIYIYDTDSDGETLVARPLDYQLWDKGLVSTHFSLSNQFNPGYWTFAYDKKPTGKNPHKTIFNLSDGFPGVSSKWSKYNKDLSTPEPLHLSYLENLEEVDFQIENMVGMFNKITIDLKFMTLKYLSYNITSFDSMMKLLKSPNLFDSLLGINQTIYVSPIDSHTSIIIPTNKEDILMLSMFLTNFSEFL